jgi:hypothetical protein
VGTIAKVIVATPPDNTIASEVNFIDDSVSFPALSHVAAPTAIAITIMSHQIRSQKYTCVCSIKLNDFESRSFALIDFFETIVII